MADSNFIPDDQFESDTPSPPGSGNPGVRGSDFIPDENFQDDEDKYGSTGQLAITGLEGVAQGVLGPLAPIAERAVGVSPEDIRMRAATNPITHGAGEVAGFGGSMLTGIGEGALIGKLGEGASALAGLGEATTAARVVRGASEMAALQSSNEVSKAITQDPNQTLGSAAIDIGLAGIMGGAGGAVLGSVSPLWKSYTKGAAEAENVGLGQIQDGEDHLTQSILKPAEKTSFLDGIKKQKANADEIIKAGETLGLPVSSSQTSASDFVQNLDSALTQSPTVSGIMRQQEIDKSFGKIEDVLKDSFGNPESSTPYERGGNLKDQIQDKVDELYDPLKNGYRAQDELGQTIDLSDNDRIKQYNKLIEMSQNFGSRGSRGGQAIRDVAERFLSQDNMAHMDEFMKELSQESRTAYRSGDTHLKTAIDGVIDSVDEFQTRQIAKAGKQLAVDGADNSEAIAKDMIAERKALKAKYADFKDTLSQLGLGKKATTAGGIEDVLDNIPNEKLADKMFDNKNFAKLQHLKDKFPQVFDTVVQGKKSDIISAAFEDGRLNVRKVLSGIEKLSPEIREAMFKPEELERLDAAKTWVGSLPKKVGPSGTPQGMAYMNAIHGNPISSIIANAKDVGISAMLRFAHPEELEVNKAAGDYINSSLKGQKLLNSATQNIFKSGAQVIPTSLIPDQSSRDKLKKSLDYASDPQNAMNIGGNIGHYMPDHATAAAAMAATAKDYLGTLKPRQPINSPLDTEPPLDKFQEAKYNRALDVAQQPLVVLKHAKDGTLLPQDVQTLNTIYPSLHGKIVDKINENLIQAKNDGVTIPYYQKQSLSLLLGKPLDSTMTQSSMQSIINSAQRPAPAQQGQAKPHKASGKALDQMNKVNSMYSTPAQSRLAHEKDS